MSNCVTFEKGADLITWDLAEGRSGAIAEDLPGDRGAGCGEAGRGVTPGTPACPHGRDQWLTVLAPCLRQARGWRVPPRWSASDWFEELRAEGAVAAWEAARDFDPGRGIPLWAFVRRRVLFHLLHHYRKEWAHAVRLHPEGRPLAAESDSGPQ